MKNLKDTTIIPSGTVVGDLGRCGFPCGINLSTLGSPLASGSWLGTFSEGFETDSVKAIFQIISFFLVEGSNSTDGGERERQSDRIWVGVYYLNLNVKLNFRR